MKPKLLVLTPRFPYPPIGGDRLRIYQLCKNLSCDFELSLLSMCESTEEMNQPIPDDGIFSRVERVLHGKWARIWGLFSALLSGEPLQVGYYRNSRFAQRVRELGSSHEGLLAHLIRTGSYIRTYKLPKFLEMTDAISLSYTRTSALTGRIKAMIYGWEGRRLLDYERQIVSDCDLTIMVSSVDRDFLFPNGDQPNIMVCSNGVDTREMPFSYSPDNRTIVFIGKNFAHYNVDAILYFAEVIFPIVRLRCPTAQFKVVGQIKRELELRLRELDGVIVTGPVESIANAVQHAAVGVCPLRFGAGVQNKLLEYMALGIPAVTSPVGLEGLDAIHGVHLLVAQEPQEWADHICRFLSDPEQGKGFALAGRQFVEQYHSWQSLIAPLRSAIAARI